MRKVLIVASIIAGLAGVSGCSKTESKSLNVPEEHAVATPTLAQQKMCAEQAKVTFDEYQKAPSFGQYFHTVDVEYTNHFDVKTTTCYVEIVDTSTDREKNIITSKTVSDAFEGRVYGSYEWSTVKGKKYWEVAPLECSIKTRQQAETKCHSGDEFDSLVLQNFGTGE